MSNTGNEMDQSLTFQGDYQITYLLLHKIHINSLICISIYSLSLKWKNRIAVLEQYGAVCLICLSYILEDYP